MALAQVIAYARKRNLLVIVDAKRNDIGSTADAYAAAYFGPEAPWPADALTVSPYLGDDSLSPFVDASREHGGGFHHGGHHFAHFHHRRFYGGYYPSYSSYYPHCRIVYTYYGPRRVCGYHHRWHHRRWHHRRYW